MVYFFLQFLAAVKIRVYFYTLSCVPDGKRPFELKVTD